MVLRAVFRMTTDQALGVMLTAHQRGRLRGRGLHPRDRRDQGDPGDRHGAREQGYPLMFTTEPED